MSEQLTIEDRYGIIALKKHAKWTQKEISTALNCSQSVVSKTLKRYRETEEVKNRNKSGRPSLISIEDEQNNLITEQIENNRQITSSAIANNLNNDYDISISAATIRRLRHSLRYKQTLYKICPQLSEFSKRRRLNYVEKYRNFRWSNVIFSDEKVFSLSKEGLKVWKRSDENPIITHQPLKPISLMVWGGIWMTGRTSIHITEDIIDADEYQNIIFEHLIDPESDRHRIFQQDNARPHKARSTLEFFRAMNVQLLEDYPPYSPELNPIEKVWSWMSNYVSKIGATDKEELMEAIDSAWTNIPQEIIQSYILHLHTVCDLIEQSNGGSILE